MGWGWFLLVLYLVVTAIVVSSESKLVRAGAVILWALAGLAIGHFAWNVFG